jgi:hypothetical protein
MDINDQLIIDTNDYLILEKIFWVEMLNEEESEFKIRRGRG